jgi:VWFA-related protein
LAVALGAAVWGVCQTDPEPTPRPIGGLSFVDEVEVTVVNVDVYVRDGKGRPVEGLTVDDFRIKQDGIEMPISNFVELTQEVIEHAYAEAEIERALPAPREEPAVVEEFEIRPVYMVIYIDNENLQPLHRNRVLRRVREFVAENLQGPVQMMVVSYQRSLKVLQPFTDSSRDVNDALRSVVKYAGGREERDNTRRKLIADIQEANQAYSPGQDPQTRRGVEQRYRQQIMTFAEEEALNVSFTLDALRQVLAMVSGLDGRKSVVYVSSGLPMTPGLGLMHEYATVFNDTSFLSRRSRTDRTRAFSSLTSAANAQEVSLYTIDASGLNPLEGFSAEDKWGATDPTASSIGMKNYQDSLRYMARYTGGLSIVNTNDISGGLESIRNDLVSYYSLGYTISSSGLDRVHKITVELPGRPGHDLRYRRRFVEKSFETRVQDRVFSSLLVDIDDNPMGLEVTGEPAVPASGDRWTVPVHLSFPLENVALMPEAEDYVGRLVLFLGARDADGRESEIQREEHVIRVPVEQYETAKQQGFGIDFQLLLREGQQRICVGLMDQVTRQASYERIVVRIP